MSSLVFRITGDPSAFKAAMGEVSGSLDAVGKRSDALSAKLGSLGNSLSLGITAPVLAMGAAAVKASADMDTLKRALESTAGNADDAAKQFDRLKEIAKLPGIGLEEAVRGSIRLQNYGLSAELAEKALRNFSNAVAGAGGSAEDTQEALRQLGQLFGRGKVTLDNLKIIVERVPQAAAIIRKEFGPEALGDPAKVFEQLGINSEKFVSILIERMGQVPKTTAGVKTALENLKQEITISAARIGDKLAPAVLNLIPAIEGLANGAANVVEVFTKLPSVVQSAGLALGGVLVLAGPLAVAFRGVATAITAVRDAYIAMTAAQAVSTGVGAAAGAFSAAKAAKDVADAAAGIRAAKTALDAAVGIGYAETLAAQAALKTAQDAYWAAVAAEKAAVTLGAASRTAALGLGAMAGAATAGGLAVATVIGALNTSNTALAEQKKATDAAADSMKRLNDRYQDFKNISGKSKTPSFAEIDREISNRITQLTGESQSNPVFEGLISSMKKTLPSVQSLFASAGVKSVQDYQAAIDKAAKLVDGLNSLQSQGVNVSKNLAIARKELSDAEKALAAAMGQTTEKHKDIIVTSVAMRDATGALLPTSLAFVEMQERVKSAVGRVKDVMYEYITSGTALGKPISLATDVVRTFITEGGNLGSVLVSNTKDFSDLARRSEDYAASLRSVIAEQEKLVANDNVKNLGGTPLGFPKLPTTWTGQDAMSQLGIRSEAKIREDIARAEARLAEVQQSNREGGPGAATGNDVIKAQQHVRDLYKEITGEAEKSGRKQSEAWKQVSTIATDLSRSLANTSIGLLFDRPKADVSSYREELVKLRAEEEKLMTAQRKGQNVTAKLAEVHQKMADVNAKMAAAVEKTTFSFRAMAAVKSVFEDLAKSITRVLIEGALKKLAGSLLDIGKTSTGVFGGLSKVLGGVFGSGSKGASPIFSNVPNVVAVGLENGGLGKLPGFGGGGSSSGISGAASGFASIANVVTGAISAISSVVSNFQLVKLEKTLNAIEQSTRYLKIYTGEQSDSILNTSHLSLKQLNAISANTKGIVGINIAGSINSQQTQEVINRLIDGSQSFWADSQGTLISIHQALVSGFASISQPLNRMANPSLLTRLLSSSGLFGGIGASTGGGIGQAATLAATGPLGALASLLPNRQEGTLNAVELNTRKSSIYLGGQSQSILWSTQKTAEYMGYAVAALDAIGRFSSETLANIQQINQASLAGGGDVYNFDFTGAQFGSGVKQSDIEAGIAAAVSKYKIKGNVR